MLTSDSGAGLGKGFSRFFRLPTTTLKNEVWEFPPDSIVRTEVRRTEEKQLLLAVAR